VSKRIDTDTDFGVAVAVTPEADITHLDATGRHVPQPGKVDAYRFMTFYMAPSGDHHDLFFQQVVDPIWLEQSADPAAVALRGARQPAQRPACWRVLHRVTYVSRILEPVSPQPDAFTQALRALDLNSNYEMVRTLAPYVASRTASLGDFVLAVRQAVQRRLPDLLGHLDQVTEYLAGYYGLEWTS